MVDGSYPVDTYDDVLSLLKSARHNEYEEYEDVYPTFWYNCQRRRFS